MTERYEVINREEGRYPISSMCRWSGVSKSGYYSWRDRPQSQTSVRREELAMMIKEVFERSDGTYGYRRIQVVLERRGWGPGGWFHDPVHHEGPGAAGRAATGKGPNHRAG